ncbi:unnamed protein product [Closterium sp. NIES-65]|nr:unnamed protein product [Closterium sp. NIES-65]
MVGLQRVLAMPKCFEDTDPYYYRERLTMPKLLVSAANDEVLALDDTYIWRNDMPEPKLLSPTGPSPQPAVLPNLPFSPTCHSPQPIILPNLPFSPTCHSPQPVILPNLPFFPTWHSPQPVILPNLPFSPTCHSPQPAILPNLPFSPTCHSPQPAILPNLPFSPTCHSPQPAILPNLPFSPTCHSPQPAILPNLPFSPTCPFSPAAFVPPTLPPPPSLPGRCDFMYASLIANITLPPYSPMPSFPKPSAPPSPPPLSTPPLHPPSPPSLSTPPLHPPSPPPLSIPPLHPPSPPPLSTPPLHPPSPTPLSNPPLQTTLQANQATLSFLASLLHVNSSCASLPASSRPSLTWTRPSNAPPSPRRRKRFDKTEGTGLFAREERETAERETAEAQTGEGGVGGSEGDARTNQEQPPHPWGCIPELPAVNWPKLRWRFDWSTFTIHATSDSKPLVVRAWTGRTASERRDFRFVLQRGSKGCTAPMPTVPGTYAGKFDLCVQATPFFLHTVLPPKHHSEDGLWHFSSTISGVPKLSLLEFIP